MFEQLLDEKWIPFGAGIEKAHHLRGRLSSAQCVQHLGDRRFREPGERDAFDAAAAILDGMPDARDLHRLDSGGQVMIFAGSVQLFWYAEDDAAARNVAVAVLRQLGFGGAEVAAVMKVTPNYVSTLYQRSLREGTAGLIRPLGRPRETAGASWEKARAWRADGVRDAEIARRLGVNQSTVLRRLGPVHAAEPLPLEPRRGRRSRGAGG